MTERESHSTVAIVALVALLGLMMHYTGFFGGGDSSVAVTGGLVTSTSGLWQCDDGDSETETSSDANIWWGDITQTRTRRSSSAPWSSWTTRVGGRCYGVTLDEGYCLMLDSPIVYVGSNYITCEYGCLEAGGTSFCRLPTCTDSDAGLSATERHRTRGTTTGIRPSEARGIWASQSSRTYTDSCTSNTSVYEYFCSNYGYSTWDNGTATFSPPNQAVTRSTVSCPAAYPNCVDGECVAPPCTPTTERCNGQDDDCDGLIDENAVAEICNGRDDDCDRSIDEGCDDDDDNRCDSGMTRARKYVCLWGGTNCCPLGGGDCNDASASVRPGATEVCGNGIDEDCSGADLACPSTPEICDNLDNDADGSADEGCDDDNDNYCDSAMTRSGTPTTCTAGGGDCNDASASVRPGATEICGNGIDEDCSGADLACPSASSTEICDNSDNDRDKIVDEGCDDDNDNYCDSAMTRSGTPTTCTAGGGDCNDASASVRPSATEVCGNGIDENCDGVDASCPATTPTSPTCTDTTDPTNSREVVGVVRGTDPTATTPTGGEVPGTSIAGGLYEYKDACSGTTTLYQYSCIGTDVRRYDFACPPRLNPSEYGFCTTDATGGGYCPRCATTPSAAGCPSS